MSRYAHVRILPPCARSAVSQVKQQQERAERDRTRSMPGAVCSLADLQGVWPWIEILFSWCLYLPDVAEPGKLQTGAIAELRLWSTSNNSNI